MRPHCQSHVTHSYLFDKKWTLPIVSSAASWYLGGWFHSRRVQTQCQQAHKRLYQEYYQDVVRLMEQSRALQDLVEDLQLERDKVRNKTTN
jgi:hypothetical protein